MRICVLVEHPLETIRKYGFDTEFTHLAIHGNIAEVIIESIEDSGWLKSPELVAILKKKLDENTD